MDRERESVSSHSYKLIEVKMLLSSLPLISLWALSELTRHRLQNYSFKRCGPVINAHLDLSYINYEHNLLHKF